MKILLIDDEVDLCEIYACTLEMDFDAEVITAHDGIQAINILKVQDDFDVIICDYNMPKANGGEVYKFVLEKYKETPFIVFSTEELADHSEFDHFTEDHPGNGQIIKPVKREDYLAVVQHAIDSTSNREMIDFQSAKQVIKPSDYVKLPKNIIRMTDSLPVSLYIHLNGKNNRYIKVYSANDPHVCEIVKHYEDKNIENYYVPNEQYDELIQYLFKKSSSGELADKSPEVVAESVRELFTMQFDRLKDQLVDWNMEAEGENSVLEETVNYIDSLSEQPSILSELLKKLEVKCYLSDHSMLVALLSSRLLKHTKWDSAEGRHKLAMAAMLHDLGLEDEKLAVIQVKNNDYFRTLDGKERVQVLGHPEKLAELIKSDPKIPYDVSQIVREHHERPGGLGFPKGLRGPQMFPLSCVFIVAHEFVFQFSGVSLTGVDVHKVMADMKEQFQEAPYNLIMKALMKAIKS